MSRGLLAGLLLVLPAAAAAQHPLARPNGCLVCHAVEKKVIGPALRDVAARYAGQPAAAEGLARTILQGGVGRWGTQPMPPNAGVSEGDALVLARWILSLPPGP